MSGQNRRRIIWTGPSRYLREHIGEMQAEYPEPSGCYKSQSSVGHSVEIQVETVAKQKNTLAPVKPQKLNAIKYRVHRTASASVLCHKYESRLQSTLHSLKKIRPRIQPESRPEIRTSLRSWNWKRINKSDTESHLGPKSDLESELMSDYPKNNFSTYFYNKSCQNELRYRGENLRN